MPVVLLVLAACGTGVNDDLISTPTPYPIRSPVAAASTPAGTAVVGEAASFVAAGHELLAAGDAAGAERAFDRALARMPGDLAARLGRAEARLADGDVAGAREDLNAAVETDPDDGELLRLRGELRLRFGDRLGAEADCDAALVRDPGDAAAFVCRGLAILAGAGGDRAAYDRALGDFRRATTLEPSLVLARLGPALVYADRAGFGGDPADWQRAADELTGLGETVAPEYPRRAALEAVVQTALGQPETAARAVSGALGAGATGPDLATLHAAEAEVALAHQDWSAAAAAAGAGIAADPLAWDARRAAIRAELGRGDAAAALAAADELLALLPGDGRGHYFRGMALASLGRDGDAQEAFAAARAALPASAVYSARIAEAVESLASPVATPDAPVRIVLTPRARETPRAVVAR